MLGGGLSLDQARRADELIDNAEFGSALETLADWLGENRRPIAESIRHDFERLSTRLEDRERVMQAIERCPAETDAQD
jgi:hypothetical protein